MIEPKSESVIADEEQSVFLDMLNEDMGEIDYDRGLGGLDANFESEIGFLVSNQSMFIDWSEE